MRRSAVILGLCFGAVLAIATPAQSPRIEAVRVTAGSILSFHLQTRLKPTVGSALDVLPSGTVLRVKMLDSIDSGVDRDGAVFHGAMASSLVSGDQVIIHTDAEVRGLLALLRSRSHPEGFRYELLITGLTDGGKSYTLTASLSSSVSESATPSASSSKTDVKGNSSANPPEGGKPSQNQPK